VSLLRPSTPNTHAEAAAMAALPHQLRLDDVAAVVYTALAVQAARPAENRNRELVDLCLDLRNALARPAVPQLPVIPGRP
jgi:hypothetical protein